MGSRSLRGLLLRVIALLAVTALLGGVLVVVFDNLQYQPQRSFRAQFANVSGLAAGDDVRAAGVDVGRVQSLTLESGNQVLVTFTVANAVPVTRDTTLTVRYQDLLGNRYLELSQPAVPGPALAAGATIPAGQTQAALSLDALLNGFQPLFQGLQPAQINELSSELISILQGEGGTIDGLLESIGSATSTIANRDQLIGQVIDNLDAVLGTVSQHDSQLSVFVIRLQQLVTALASDRDTIGNSLGDIAGVTGNLAGLLQAARPDISGTIYQVNRLATMLNRNSSALNASLSAIPDAYSRLDRQGLYGGFFQFYLCAVSIRFTGPTGQPVSTPMITSEAKRCQG